MHGGKREEIYRKSMNIEVLTAISMSLSHSFVMRLAGTSLRMAFIGVVGCLRSTTETKMRHLVSASSR